MIEHEYRGTNRILHRDPTLVSQQPRIINDRAQRDENSNNNINNQGSIKTRGSENLW